MMALHQLLIALLSTFTVTLDWKKDCDYACHTCCGLVDQHHLTLIGSIHVSCGGRHLSRHYAIMTSSGVPYLTVDRQRLRVINQPSALKVLLGSRDQLSLSDALLLLLQTISRCVWFGKQISMDIWDINCLIAFTASGHSQSERRRKSQNCELLSPSTPK